MTNIKSPKEKDLKQQLHIKHPQFPTLTIIAISITMATQGVFGIKIENGMEREPFKKGKGKDNGCYYLLFGMLMERETPINIALSLHNQYN